MFKSPGLVKKTFTVIIHHFLFLICADILSSRQPESLVGELSVHTSLEFETSLLLLFTTVGPLL